MRALAVCPQTKLLRMVERPRPVIRSGDDVKLRPDAIKIVVEWHEGDRHGG